MNNTSMVSKDRLDFDPSIPEDERRFYQKAYPNVNFVRERKVHCTVCKMHIGTAPSNESIIRMHPILRVTHCKKCHEFYNSGEFSKGEDGSELYCRWCGQGGEVYCCSNCPFVFCKSCIISNLSRGVVADIEQNENWSCFNCAPKMLWPLRAQHWALIKFIDKQKKAILNSNLSDTEIKTQMIKDRSLCCKIKKVGGYGTDSSDSSDISLSRLKQKAGEKRSRKSSKDDLSSPASQVMAKKSKPNDEVVCTPDVMSMLEPECQLTVAPNAKSQPQPSASSPKIMSIPQTQKRTSPPPLMNRNPQMSQPRPMAPSPVVKKTIVGPRLPTGVSGDFTTPVYHTINGYRIDLNSAAQQDTVRLPNGKLIQVKRQGTGPQTVTTVQSAPNQHGTPTRIIHNVAPPLPVASPIANVPTSSIPTIPTMSTLSTLPAHPTHPSQQVVHSSGGHIIRTQLQTPRSITVQNSSIMPQYQQAAPQQQQYQQITIRQPNQQIATIRYQGSPNQQVTNLLQNGTVQLLNGTSVATAGGQMATVRQLPTFVKQFFPNTPLGLSRNQLQNQIFSAMEICQHLMGKVQTLTNSNAYKTAKSLTDVKELYIHLSYLLTYAIGRFKGLQDSCLTDMRELGFINDANSLENGQLAAGMDMVRSGKITDFSSVDLDSFHNLVLENINRMKKEAIKLDVKTNDKLNCHESNIEENETSKTYNEWEVKKEEKYTEESDDDDCLLVELGERKSDDECDLKYNTYNNGSNEEDDEEGVVQKFSTSYENDDDYKAPPSGGFTLELDAKLIELVKSMPGLWDPDHQKNSSAREKNQMWIRLAHRMPKKQASDAEEDEITIVEPKTDTINLDSDNEDDPPAIVNPPEKTQQLMVNTQANAAIANPNLNVENISNMNPSSNINMMPNPIQNQTQTQTQTQNQIPTQTQIQTQTQTQTPTPTQNQNQNPNPSPSSTPATAAELQEELGQYDFSKVANLLAGLLDVELTEGGETIQLPQKKPRKKTTNKPNPTLLKQKEIQERERLNNIKKNDAKLKMQVQIPLNKVEDIYEYAKPLVEELKQGKTKKREPLEPLKEDTEKVHVKKLEENLTADKKNADEPIKSLEAPLKIIVANNKETDKAPPESQTDDKEESEEVVVVVVEDLDNSKEDEEPKNETEDNDETVEIIEREEESQDSDRDFIEKDDVIQENEKKKPKLNEVKTDDKLEEKETEDELPMIDEKEDEEKEGESVKEVVEETEILINFDNNTAETVQCAKSTDSHKKVAEAMDIDTDPLLNVGDKSLLVPTEIENMDKDEQSSPDSSHSSHNLDFNRVLGRTEVA